MTRIAPCRHGNFAVIPRPTMATHSWKFFRAGGFDQVKLESGADLLSLDQLDQKLWVALACPTTGIVFDPQTLALIDTDKDGRIRAPELITACRWAGGLLRNADDLLQSSPTLPLAAINDATPEGKALLSSARQILSNLGKKDASAIGLEELANTSTIFAQTLFNGDGIVPVEAAGDPATQAVITDVIACFGSVPDRSGKPGINTDLTTKFFAELTALDGWHKKAVADAATITPLGTDTAAAAAVRAVKTKVDDYFGRCRLVAYDPRALTGANREEKEYLAIGAKDLSLTATEIAGFPLTQIAAGRPLALKAGINPAWADAVAKLNAVAIQPIVGERENLTEGDWAMVTAKLGPYEGWNAAKAGAGVEKLGLARVREILGSKALEQVTALIAQDKALESESNAIGTVEKLIRYHRDLYRLCINFVNFKDLYDGGDPAIFQVGTLYLDQRSCSLCIAVEDAGRHATMAGLAGAYLAYVDCIRKGTGEKMSIVAVFSQGDDDNLMVGRNGLFYDRKGKDYDATITKILSNPISMRQAFWSPYKKFVRMIEEQVSKRAAAADAVATDQLTAAANAAANADKTVTEKAAADKATADKLAADKAKAADAKKIDVGMVAALSVAFGSIGTALAYVLGLFKDVTPIQVVLGICGLIAVISGPSMILAFIKLRKRNLGPILDANGWAVNSKAKINVPFGTTLTGIATLPPGSVVDSTDSFADRVFPWKKWAVVLVLVYLGFNWFAGNFDMWLPFKLDSISVLGEHATESAKTKADVRAKTKSDRIVAAAAAAKAANPPEKPADSPK